MEIFKANAQWRTRPNDQRFPDLETLHRVCKQYADQAREKVVPWADIRVEKQNDDVVLMGKAGVPAHFSNWAFGQLCSRVQAPPSYIRTLPATLAIQNINHGLKNRADNGSSDAHLLFHQNGNLLLRALTTEDYHRVWNYEIAEYLLELKHNQGWEEAVPDKHRIWSPEQEGVTAIYGSDHDMFAFLRQKNVTIEGSGDPNRPIYRGLMVWQSEVGACGINFWKFLYNSMCGNHIVWGASELITLNLRHVGQVRDKFSQYKVKIEQYANESVSDIEAKIKKSKTVLIADTKEGVLDAIFGKRQLNLSRKLLNSGYDAVVVDEDGDPRTPWGIVAGLTRFSQKTPYADERTEIDKSAAKILEVF